MRGINTFATFLLFLFTVGNVYGASFYVQLGAYRDPQNANLAEVNGLGQIEQIAGRDGITRIRVVGLDSKAAASDVLSNAQQQGFSDAYIGQRSAGASHAANTQSSSEMYIPAYSGPSSQRMNAARAKVSPEQYGDIVYLDGKLFLKEEENFRPLE